VDSDLTREELDWLGTLDVDAPVKPDVPSPVADRLVALGLAIRLVEGGLQLTTLGREHLSGPKAGESSVVAPDRP
jgi:hypothetical protein